MHAAPCPPGNDRPRKLVPLTPARPVPPASSASTLRDAVVKGWPTRCCRWSFRLEGPKIRATPTH